MRITCLIPILNKTGNITDSLNHGGCAASMRLQLRPAYIAAQKRNHSFSVVSYRKKNEIPEDFLNTRNDLLIIGKLGGNDPKIVKSYGETAALIAKHTITSGGKICLFYSDNLLHSALQETRLFYKNFIPNCDYIICPTTKLQEYCLRYINTKSKQLIIEDPCLLEKHEFTSIPAKSNVRLSWFGHESNCTFLIKLLPRLISDLDSKYNFELSILTSKRAILEISKAIKKRIKPYNNITFNFQIWSDRHQPKQLQKFLQYSHISIIPTSVEDKRKNGASHNRLTDSIQSGCIAIANPIDSYKHYKNSSILTNDIPSAINFAVNHYADLTKIFDNKRDLDLKKFSPTENLAKWSAFFDEVNQSCMTGLKNQKRFLH